ncbi:MAG: diadenylate cyclase CdaA [Bacteroidales bacterium]|nr:diadenylate cyclase CdaA [Bacteroidales bacterium]MDD4362447.1 diadenylate cyclase CdaA [Bacteroidales bacterium]MDD4362450.1 diadenylate cyclase CdaA [Bacteroidales bacterium]MDD4430135.1 diadenylate cyclase CdaA [Bacteroidales bacterium]
MPSLLDIIDIFLVALLLYGIYKLMKSSGAINIFIGVLSFIALWILVSYIFKMKLLGGILDKVVSVGAIALIVLFQNELRRFLVMLGSRRRWKNFVALFSQKKNKQAASKAYIVQIVLACKNLAESKTGALIVIENNISLDEYLSTGERTDALVSYRLLENIFYKNTPLHDGAVIVANERIKAAACILPVSRDESIPKQYGLRHRSALGISQVSDAKAIVVSEETGHIALAYMGKIYADLSSKELDRMLNEENGGFLSTPGKLFSPRPRRIAEED